MRKKLLLSLMLFLGTTMVSFAAASYCTPTLSGGPGDWNIARVLLTGSNGTLDNTGGASTNSPSYYDYFSGAFVPVLVSGDQYTVSIQIGGHTFGDVNIAAWIDFNGDQVFSTGEKIGQTDNMGPNAISSYTFTGTAEATRLRVISHHSNPTFNPCETGSDYGEIEDYDINFRYVAPLVGGGKKYVPPVDNCPEGDLSPTQYDGLCAGMSASNGVLASAASTGTTTTTTGSISTTGTVSADTGDNTTIEEENTPEVITPIGWRDMDMCPEEEIEDAYLFAHENGITTMDTCVKARTNDFITRGEVAKMVVNYAINVLHMTLPDTDKPCKFTDMADKNMETRSYAIGACQLGIMGLKGDGTPAETFNPNGLLDKAQFATMISRMTYGSENNDMACWYCKHVEALKADGTITVTTDLMLPLRRGYAMLMLLRMNK